MALSLVVQPATADAGPLPQTLRPNLFINGSTANDLGQFIQIPNVSMLLDDLVTDMGGYIEQSVANFRAILNDPTNLHIGRALRSGVSMILKNEVFTAPYIHSGTFQGGLAISGSRFNKANGIPSDLTAYRELWRRMALVPFEFGISTDQIFWSFRNEFSIGAAHDAGGLNGSLDDMVSQYAAHCHGIKSANPNWRVGGPEIAYLAQVKTTGDLTNAVRETTWWDIVSVLAFIRKCANPPRWLYGGARIPIDFITMHYFNDTPWIHEMNPLRSDLAFCGYDPDKVSLIMSEINNHLVF